MPGGMDVVQQELARLETAQDAAEPRPVERSTPLLQGSLEAAEHTFAVAVLLTFAVSRAACSTVSSFRSASAGSTHGWNSAALKPGNVRRRLPRSPLGSIAMTGTPSIRASSMRSMDRPVLPDPVMPTMTPCVVRSLLGYRTGAPT